MCCPPPQRYEPGLSRFLIDKESHAGQPNRFTRKVRRILCALVAIEDVREVGGWYADAMIFDLEHRPIPFGTRWMGESGVAPLPSAAYGGVLLLSAVAYTILVRCILACQPPDSLLASAIGTDRKGWISLVLYVAALPLALVNGSLAVPL